MDFSLSANTIKTKKAPRRWARGRKRCTKGKSCRATCIYRGLICQVELGESVSKSLGKIRTIRRSSSVAAHPLLSKDYTESNVKKAIDSISELDKDADRRVNALKKIFNRTKTVFIDWKDDVTNRKIYVEATSKLHKSAEANFDDKVHNKTWVGVAFRGGSTMVKASPGFNPSVKQVKTLITRQLNELSGKGKTPYSMGKGTKALGNNPLVTLVHELGHHAHFATNERELPPYLKEVSTYAGVNHKEKYAELFAAYIFAGPKLKALYPAEYEAVEDILSKANLL